MSAQTFSVSSLRKVMERIARHAGVAAAEVVRNIVMRLRPLISCYRLSH